MKQTLDALQQKTRHCCQPDNINIENDVELLLVGTKTVKILLLRN